MVRVHPDRPADSVGTQNECVAGNGQATACQTGYSPGEDSRLAKKRETFIENRIKDIIEE